MNDREELSQSERISKYRELCKRRSEIYAAIKAISSPQPDGPHGQGPFTGNTRESRRVKSMHIQFTATRGGAAPVEMHIGGLHIEASELGRALESMLREKLGPINEAIEKL